MYTVVFDADVERFDEEICNMLKDGWELYGHPFAHDGGLCQAMTWEEVREIWQKWDDQTNQWH